MNDITSLNGARIGIMSKPSAEFVAGIWATWISGAVAVPLALSHPKTEILYVMNDAVCIPVSHFLLLYIAKKWQINIEKFRN
jgi:acyl-CoA synthetase (AMP-forming)/AMP-acid ligase II